MQHTKRLLTLVLLLSVMLMGIMPTFAQVDTADLTAHLDNYLQNELPQGFGSVSPADVFTEMLENPPFLLDVREPAELEELGYLMGAVNIPIRQIAANLDKLPALDAPIVVYCKVGGRGTIAMTVLQILGYTNVRNMTGGIEGWLAAEYEVMTEPIAAPAVLGMPDIDPALVETVDNYLQNVLPQGWGGVRAADVFTELMENPPFLLDVREQNEVDSLGYIEGAVHIPLRQVVANLDQLPADTSTPIVIYCHGGLRGSIGMVALQMLGYNVRNLSGGIQGWITAGYETVGAVPAEQTAGFDLVTHLDNYMQNVLPQGWGSVKADDVFAETLENPPFLLDVREVSEVEQNGYIEGAVNIPLREIARNLNLLPGLDDPIVVYCKVGGRGAMAMVSLQVLGYTNVRNMAGGFDGWVGQDYAIVTDPMPEPVAGEAPAIDAELLEIVDDYLTNIPQGFGNVGVDAVFTELLENPPFLLDVREISEWETDGYIEGAVNVPLRTVVSNLSQLPEDKDAPIVVYCKVGGRGAIGMTVVQMLGYTNVRNMAGGITGWMNAGYAIEGGAAAEPAAPAEVVLPTGTPLTAEELQPFVVDYLTNIPQGFSSIPAEPLQQQIGSVFLLDVRELDEYEGGHIEGAVNIPVREVVQNLHLLPPKDAAIVVYCASGHRGVLATSALEMLGYTNVVNLRSGIRTWTDAGGAIVTESTPAVQVGAFPEVDANLWAAVDAYMSSLPQGFSTIRGDDLNLALLEGDAPFILDVREVAEFTAGHIEGAVNIPVRELPTNMDQLPAMDAAIVVYDSIGQRSAQALMALQLMGYENVRGLAGGSNGWAAAGYELVTP